MKLSDLALGALPSVVGGLVAVPVIAVPTSVGYGASFGGATALLGMLNSCSPNVTVVNKTITTTFDVTLAPRSSVGLTTYIASLSDTASPNFHHYLSTAQFAQRFGFNLATLRQWEQGRRCPDGAARALLAVISHAPDVVMEAVAAA